MREMQRIADQLRRAIDGGAWHGPSLSEALDGVKATQAAVRQIPSADSIWELTLHVAALPGTFRATGLFYRARRRV